MRYFFRNLDKKDTDDISTWQYKDEYYIYSMNQNNELYDELLGGSYYAVDDESGKLIGYFCNGDSAQVPNEYGIYADKSYTDIGLGLKPSMCGVGCGLDFVNAGLSYFSNRLDTNKFRLTVASFNTRAIKVYQRAGFKYKTSFVKKSSDIEFYVMTKDEEN